LIGVGLSTVIAVTNGFKTDNSTAPVAVPVAQIPASQPASQPEAPAKPIRVPTVSKKKNTDKTGPEPTSHSQSIKVVMQVENGRVLKASIANPKAGMESYEALALRIARQRRFAPTTNGGETVTITVRPQE
jgi:hypothetical protein